MSRFLPLLACAAPLMLAAFPGFSDELDYLDSRYFGSAGVCDAAVSDSVSDLPDAIILTGDGGRREFLFNYPGTCSIDSIVSPKMYGRGSEGVQTAMVAVSCISDVAVPDFELLALEYQPNARNGAGTVDIYPVGSPSDVASYMVGTYEECTGDAAAALVRMFDR